MRACLSEFVIELWKHTFFAQYNAIWPVLKNNSDVHRPVSHHFFLFMPNHRDLHWKDGPRRSPRPFAGLFYVFPWNNFLCSTVKIKTLSMFLSSPPLPCLWYITQRRGELSARVMLNNELQSNVWFSCTLIFRLLFPCFINLWPKSFVQHWHWEGLLMRRAHFYDIGRC